MAGRFDGQATENAELQELLQHNDDHGHADESQHVSSAQAPHDATSAANSVHTPSNATQHTVNHQDCNQQAQTGSPTGQAPSVTASPQNQHNKRHELPEEWLSKWLQKRAIFLMAALTVLLMGCLIALCVLSARKHGIAPVTSGPGLNLSGFIPALAVGISLTWTTLPVFLFTIYGMALASIVKAASARQPYIELSESEHTNRWGAAAEKSILLDYDSYWSWTAPFHAFWYRHYTLVFCFSMALIFNTVLPALAAHLLFANAVERYQNITTSLTHVFNQSSFGARDSLTPAMDIVSSTQIYGGKPFPWTTLNETLLPVSLPIEAATKGLTYNLTVPTQAYSAIADCEIVDPANFQLFENSDGSWSFSITDRECATTNQFFSNPLESSYTEYLETYALTDCSETAYYTRVILVAAQNLNGSTSELSSQTAISCIPSYWVTNGSVELSYSVADPQNPTILSFEPTESQLIDPFPEFADNFETQMQETRTYDPTANLVASSFGTMIYNYAQVLSSDAYFTPEVLLNATSTLFVATYAAVARQYLVQPATALGTVPGVLHTTSIRLVVVYPVAYTVIGILVLTLIMLGSLYQYTKHHTSILYEEPAALVGAASVLRNSELMRRIQAIDADTEKGKIDAKFIEEIAQERPQRGWIFKDWGDGGIARVVSTSEVAQYGFWPHLTAFVIRWTPWL